MLIIKCCLSGGSCLIPSETDMDQPNMACLQHLNIYDNNKTQCDQNGTTRKKGFTLSPIKKKEKW